MAKTFHLAILAGNLSKAIEFYCNVLGCIKGNSQDSWCDINFWGNELTLHASESVLTKENHDVEYGNVLVPHFGIHLDAEEFQSLKEKLIQENVEFVDKPYIRFEGDVLEQETMFIKDPNDNIIELKTMVNPDALFEDRITPEDRAIIEKLSTPPVTIEDRAIIERSYQDYANTILKGSQ
jgi:extradiol dioxygenase family protein